MYRASSRHRPSDRRNCAKLPSADDGGETNPATRHFGQHATLCRAELLQPFRGLTLPNPPQRRNPSDLLHSRPSLLQLPVVDRLGADAQQFAKLVRGKPEAVALGP